MGDWKPISLELLQDILLLPRNKINGKHCTFTRIQGTIGSETTYAPTKNDTWERAWLMAKVGVLSPSRNLLISGNAQHTSHRAAQCEGIQLDQKNWGGRGITGKTHPSG